MPPSSSSSLSPTSTRQDAPPRAGPQKGTDFPLLVFQDQRRLRSSSFLYLSSLVPSQTRDKSTMLCYFAAHPSLCLCLCRTAPAMLCHISASDWMEGAQFRRNEHVHQLSLSGLSVTRQFTAGKSATAGQPLNGPYSTPWNFHGHYQHSRCFSSVFLAENVKYRNNLV